MLEVFKKKKIMPRTFIIIFIVILTFMAFFIKIIFNKKPFFLFNYAPFIITTSSMEPQYATYSLIIIKKEAMSNLKVGDTIVFMSDALNGKLAFHRITKITAEGFFTKGDKNIYEDNQLITEDKYIGKEISHFNNFAHYFSAIITPWGFVLFLLLPICLLIMFYIAARWLIRLKKN